MEEILDVLFQLPHDGLPSSLSGVHVIPEEVLLRVGTNVVQDASILVHLPAVALAVRVKVVAAQLQLVHDELLCHLRDCTPNIYIFLYI